MSQPLSESSDWNAVSELSENTSANADDRYMATALKLAEKGLATCHPNPAVGCVIVNGGQIVGRGWHVRAGEPHAEILALKDAGESARGGCLYVTLEPCCHHGRTGPCTQEIIRSGVTRVVIAVEDPNPKVNRNGISELQRAGIDVLVGPGNNAAESLNRGFFKRMRSGLPWVVVKTAISLDGKTALASGESQWITSEAARKDGHRLRSVAGAILTGAGTVLRDDPRLTVRHVAGERQPTRVIVDSNLSTPEDAQVLRQSGKTIIFCANAESADNLTARYSELDIVPCPTPSGQVDLGGVLSELGKREINSVLVEAGEKLCGNLVKGRLVDEFVVYMAPDLLGSKGRSMVNIPGMESLQDRLAMEFVDCTRIGRDLRLTLKPAYH